MLLLGGYFGLRPHTLLSLTHRRLGLYVDKDNDTSEHVLELGIKLTRTKSRQKDKRL
jgi:hypothetical protein